VHPVTSHHKNLTLNNPLKNQMSIHATLSPDSLRLLHTQQRNSTISSILISLLSLLLLGLVFTFFLLPIIEITPAQITCTSTAIDTDPPMDHPTPNRNIVQQPPSAPQQFTPSIAAITTGSFSIPKIDNSSSINGLTAGEALGDELSELSSNNTQIPLIHGAQRCSKSDRLSRLNQFGGNEATENAVVQSLRWMKKSQSPDGSWGEKNKSAMTGLALLAYLGHCEDPSSEEFGESCLQGIIYLINLGSQNNGKLASNLKERHWPYNHAIATYALAEAYTFSARSGYTIPQHRQILQQAGQWIIDHQHNSGGWDYAYDQTGPRGGDLSIAAWQIQALKACQVTTLPFKNMKPTIRSALKYVSGRQANNGGFGYTGTSGVGDASQHSLTGAGMLAYQMWEKGSRPEVRKGARYILANATLNYNDSDCDLYAHYYNSQAMMQRGGDAWKEYNLKFRDQILLNQKNNGSWKQPGGGKKVKAAGALYTNNTPEGVHYRTALCTLMLEVYYRYLPASK